MMQFTVEKIEALSLTGDESVISLYTLSAFVWPKGGSYALLLRVVPRSDDPAEKIARIHGGSSGDGLCFAVDPRPVLAPGPGPEDADGCEDPTAVETGAQTFVYYSGWNEAQHRGQLLLAAGPDRRALTKRGVMLPPMPGYDNPKEATLAQAPDGTWRLFFEYAADDASKIGLASAPAVDGPWTVLPPPFAARPDRWDAWHLSTGPISLADPDRPTMFYNGATRDAHWRIGWIVFDRDYGRVLERSEDPLIVPPPGEPGDTDIAFASSCVDERGGVSLYYSVADKDLFRASVRVGTSSTAPG